MTRRNFFKVIATAAIAIPFSVQANTTILPEKNIKLYNTHTKEKIDTTYFKNGKYQIEELVKISKFLKDHRTGDIKAIDIDLIDFITSLKEEFQYESYVHVISGFRSEKTNKRLREKGAGVAKKSYHTKGQAIDIRMPGIKTKKISKAARKKEFGGVGYYKRSNFVHLDSGRVRSWKG